MDKIKGVQICGTLLVQGKRVTKANDKTGKGGGIPMLRVIPTVKDSSGQVYGGRPLVILAPSRCNGEDSTELEDATF